MRLANGKLLYFIRKVQFHTFAKKSYFHLITFQNVTDFIKQLLDFSILSEIEFSVFGNIL